MLIDVPEVLRDVVEKYGARPSHEGADLSLIHISITEPILYLVTEILMQFSCLLGKDPERKRIEPEAPLLEEPGSS